MILKISVKDNDFGELMEEFATRIGNGEHFHEKRPETESTIDVMCLWFKEYLETDKMIQKIYERPASKEDKESIVSIIKKSFSNFLHSKNGIDVETKEYLIKNFECKIVSSVNDRWENGEVFYIFPTSYGNKVLNF